MQRIVNVVGPLVLGITAFAVTTMLMYTLGI